MGNGPDDQASAIPDIDDKTAEKPKAGQLRLSQAAIDSRMRRVFQPNVKGEYKISSDILAQWNSKKGRKPLQQLFQAVGFNSDMGSKLVSILSLSNKSLGKTILFSVPLNKYLDVLLMVPLPNMP